MYTLLRGACILARWDSAPTAYSQLSEWHLQDSVLAIQCCLHAALKLNPGMSAEGGTMRFAVRPDAQPQEHHALYGHVLKISESM